MKTLLHFLPDGKWSIFSIFFFSIALLSTHATAQPTISFNQISGGLSQPLEIKNAGDGSGRLFIAEQGGRIKIYKQNKLLSKPFLDISTLVGVNQFQGIWSIAFSPDYINNRNFFVLYTDKAGTTSLARYKTSNTNSDSADENSGVILLSYVKSGAGHYGNLAFGKDNYLYISLGAGGNNKFSQNGLSDFGKMLRLDVKLNTAPYYSIPPDNPFINDSTMLGEVWALGLRNAWRWSFDRNNGDMWIADVGQDSMEEVDYRKPAQGLAGSNFGWQCYEGTETYKLNGCGNKNNYVLPIFEYHHDIPTGGECLIGGYVYRGSVYPALQGYYMCADFVSANLWKIISDGSGGWRVYLQRNSAPKGITSFGEGENGELYAVSNKYGALYTLQATTTLISNEAQSVVAVPSKKLRSLVYPTLVDNNMITVELKEAYNSVSILDMAGHEIMKQNISGKIGKVIIQLPKLNTGIYFVLLSGAQTMQQKIYIR